jgi:hypothetical protein
MAQSSNRGVYLLAVAVATRARDELEPPPLYLHSSLRVALCVVPLALDLRHPLVHRECIADSVLDIHLNLKLGDVDVHEHVERGETDSAAVVGVREHACSDQSKTQTRQSRK